MKITALMILTLLIVGWMISSSDANGADIGIREQFGPLFDKYEVDLVVCGHEHDYERSHPVRGVVSGSQNSDYRSIHQRMTIVGLQYHERAIVFHRERRLDYRSAPNIGLAKQFAVRGGTRYGQHRAKLGSANS